jgi:hypothetical protein
VKSLIVPFIANSETIHTNRAVMAASVFKRLHTRCKLLFQKYTFRLCNLYVAAYCTKRTRVRQLAER